MPNDAADYVHRIGRTARADKKGTAISFVNEEDQPKMLNVEELIERTLDKLNPPPNVCEGPKYDPETQIKKAKSGGNKKGGKSNFKGKRPFNKSKGNWNKNRNKNNSQGSNNHKNKDSKNK